MNLKIIQALVFVFAAKIIFFKGSISEALAFLGIAAFAYLAERNSLKEELKIYDAKFENLEKNIKNLESGVSSLKIANNFKQVK